MQAGSLHAICLSIRNQRFHVRSVCLPHAEIATFVAGHLSAFAAVEVILSALALQEFAALCQFDAFGYGLVGLEFHISCIRLREIIALVK